MSVMLSPKEAALLLNVGMTRIYALLYAGQIEGHKADDGKWSIPQNAIEERLKVHGRKTQLG